MKKNLMIAMFFVSILMISVVSAGITGYLVGKLDIVDGTQVQQVSSTGITVDGRNVPVGETFTTRDGTLATVTEIKKPFLGRPRASISVTPIPTGSSSGSSTSTGHTHLSEYRYLSAPLPKKVGSGFNSFSQTLKCDAFGQDYRVLGGGFQLLGLTGQAQASYDVLTNGPIDQNTYAVDIKDYSSSVDDARIFATCALIEPTLHAFGQDY